jgi:hypothetical protein
MRLKKVIKKFLQAYTAYTAQGVATGRGVNDANLQWVQVTVGTTMAAADTLAVTVPPGQAAGLLPVDSPLPVYTLAGSTYSTQATQLAVTSHNVSTGVTILTASGAIPAGAILSIPYAPIAAING